MRKIKITHRDTIATKFTLRMRPVVHGGEKPLQSSWVLGCFAIIHHPVQQIAGANVRARKEAIVE